MNVNQGNSFQEVNIIGSIFQASSQRQRGAEYPSQGHGYYFLQSMILVHVLPSFSLALFLCPTKRRIRSWGEEKAKWVRPGAPASRVTTIFSSLSHMMIQS